MRLLLKRLQILLNIIALKITWLDHQNDYVEISSVISNDAKKILTFFIGTSLKTCIFTGLHLIKFM